MTAQTTMIKAAAMKSAGWPVARAVHFAKREKTMKNKSHWHLLSGLQICYSLAGGKEVI